MTNAPKTRQQIPGTPRAAFITLAYYDGWKFIRYSIQYTATPVADT